MAKHIHIHMPVKPALAALLLPKKTKDSKLKDLEKEYGDLEKKKIEIAKKIDVAEAQGRVPVAEILDKDLAKLVSRSAELRKLIAAEQSKTTDSTLSELQAKLKVKEEEFDKADASGDNRQMDRIRKEIENLDAFIERNKPKKVTQDEDSFKKGQKVFVKADGPSKTYEVAAVLPSSVTLSNGKKYHPSNLKAASGTKDDSANANGRKLIKTVTGSKSSCKVYFDGDWDEYQCELFVKGVWQKDATYHDDDKAEALSTAEAMVKRADANTKE